MKIRIVNATGEPHDTKVMTENGTEIQGCLSAVSFLLSAKECKGELRFAFPTVDVEAETIIPRILLEELASLHGLRLVEKNEPISTPST